jgi:chromosome partitioning protein
MRVLALVNQKGGCGKTTTAIQVASLLARSGRRTLLVDLDPQGHATLGLGAAVPPRDRSLAAVLSRSGLDEAALPLRSIVVPVTERLWLAPSGVELAELEAGAGRSAGSEERLAEHLAPLVRELDRIVIDAPPSLGFLTLNALMAASEALVPVEPSLFSLHGLARLVEVTKLLSLHSQHRISFRVFLNAYDGRTRFAKRTLDEIRRTFPDETLSTTVRSSVCVREAAARGVPVDRFAPSAPITRDYEALVSELERGTAGEHEIGVPASAGGLVVGEAGLYLTRHDVGPERVLLAGDFNAWVPDSGVELAMHRDGSWTKFVRLPPGRYEYKLVVDGRWVADPLNPERVANDAGSANSVLEIRT